MNMLTKGSVEYKKAQEIANEIQSVASVKRTEGQWFEHSFNKMGVFVDSIIKLNVFASNIATTVDKAMNPYGYQVANISSKQAWILACAAVENNVNF